MTASRVHDIQTVLEHTEGMTGVLVQIRDVDPELRDRLKTLAAQRGLSLNAYLKSILEQAGRRPTRAEVIQRLKERGNIIPVDPSMPSTVEIIHELREERERELDERLFERHPELRP